MNNPLPQIERESGLFEVIIQSQLLSVTQREVERMLGYGERKIPEHFERMIREIITQIPAMCDIKSGYRILEIKTDGRNDGLFVGGTFFNMQKIVTSQLKLSEKAALFACTIGPGMEDWRRRLELEHDEVMGLLVDTVASSAVENATDLLHDQVQMKMRELGQSVTNRFSPGYCGWSVAEQRLLFSLLPKGFCGVTLTETSLMVPIKSVSGIIGIGAKVKRKEYPCRRCKREDCMYRTSYKKGCM